MVHWVGYLRHDETLLKAQQRLKPGANHHTFHSSASSWKSADNDTPRRYKILSEYSTLMSKLNRMYINEKKKKVPQEANQMD